MGGRKKSEQYLFHADVTIRADCSSNIFFVEQAVVDGLHNCSDTNLSTLDSRSQRSNKTPNGFIDWLERKPRSLSKTGTLNSHYDLAYKEIWLMLEQEPAYFLGLGALRVILELSNSLWATGDSKAQHESTEPWKKAHELLLNVSSGSSEL